MKNKDQNNNAVNDTAFGSVIGTDAPAPPQLPNEGGTATLITSLNAPNLVAPRLVTRGGGGVMKYMR